MLKILSWNIQQGGGSRYLKILRAIEKEKAPIVVFSEYRHNSKGDLISKMMDNLGYKFIISPFDKSAMNSSWKQKNSVVIFSKTDFKGSWFPACDPEYAHSIAKAEFEAFELYACYLPHKKKHVLVPFLTEEIAKSDKPSIIVGDLNIGINGIDQKGTSFWYQDELHALFESGMEDAFRLIQGDVKEYSWFSHQGNGYRYDHSYIQEVLKPIVKDCYYLHAYREQKYSDHSPMVLELA